MKGASASVQCKERKREREQQKKTTFVLNFIS